MIRGSKESTARKAVTLIVPGTEGQAARRIAEALLAQATHNEPERRLVPGTSLIEAENTDQQAEQSKTSVAQDKRTVWTLPQAHANRSMMDMVLPSPDWVRENPTNDYVSLPLWKAGIDEKACSLGWRIELCDIVLGMESLKFNILDDVIIGRGREADIDLEPYGFLAYAVSRRHVMLRPTDNHLHLIDMDSTNGTRFNSVLLSRCATHMIEHGDMVTLGRLSFTIRIIDRPYDR